MRFAAALVAICELTQTASAQTSECRSIADADTRLACYDRIATPAAPSAKPAARTAPAANGKSSKIGASKNEPSKDEPSKNEASKNMDPISKEDALVNARLRNICRGC